jgi:hypothetical protein
MMVITTLNNDISTSLSMQWNYTSDWEELRDENVGYLTNLLPHLSGKIWEKVDGFLSTNMSKVQARIGV